MVSFLLLVSFEGLIANLVLFIIDGVIIAHVNNLFNLSQNDNVVLGVP